MSYGWPSIETMTFIEEVGKRAAMHSQTQQRDERWVKNLAWRRR